MRIISGAFKGHTIQTPSSLNARPTTDFAKVGLFNILENTFDFSGCRVLDLFSGTGSISLEFSSRGCPEVFSVEMNPLHASFISRNARDLRMAGLKVVRHNVFDFIDICRIGFDIIFADPPYALDGLDTIPDRIFGRVMDEAGHGMLNEGGVFVLEHPGTFDFSGNPHFIKERKYGNVHFTFFGQKS